MLLSALSIILFISCLFWKHIDGSSANTVKYMPLKAIPCAGTYSPGNLSCDGGVKEAFKQFVSVYSIETSYSIYILKKTIEVNRVSY